MVAAVVEDYGTLWKIHDCQLLIGVLSLFARARAFVCLGGCLDHWWFNGLIIDFGDSIIIGFYGFLWIQRVIWRRRENIGDLQSWRLDVRERQQRRLEFRTRETRLFRSASLGVV